MRHLKLTLKPRNRFITNTMQKCTLTPIAPPPPTLYNSVSIKTQNSRHSTRDFLESLSSPGTIPPIPAIPLHPDSHPTRYPACKSLWRRQLTILSRLSRLFLLFPKPLEVGWAGANVFNAQIQEGGRVNENRKMGRRKVYVNAFALAVRRLGGINHRGSPRKAWTWKGGEFLAADGAEFADWLEGRRGGIVENGESFDCSTWNNWGFKAGADGGLSGSWNHGVRSSRRYRERLGRCARDGLNLDRHDTRIARFHEIQNRFHV